MQRSSRSDKAVYGLDEMSRYRLRCLSAAYDLSQGQMMCQLINEKWDSVADGLTVSDKAASKIRRLSRQFWGDRSNEA